MISVVEVIVLVLHCASAVRISSKLDFGESSSARPVFKVGNYQDQFVLNPNVRNRESGERRVDCVDNRCQITKSAKSDSSAIASTDVVVQVNTNVNVPKNDTDRTVVDVPVIVGSKESSPYPQYYPGVPHRSANLNPSYPIGIGEFENDGFVPEGRFVDYGGYIQTGNAGHFDDNNRRAPSLNWYPQRRVEDGNVHNPLEFKKTYKNIWPTGFGSEWGTITNKRQANPSWALCQCENQPFEDFPIARKLQQWSQLIRQ